MIQQFLLRITLTLVFGCFFLFLVSNFVKFVDNTWSAISVGTIVALLYVSSGFLSIYLALTRFRDNFIRVFIVSLAARFILILVVIILIIKFTGLDEAPFLLSFFIWYFIFQIWEVLSLNSILKGTT